MCCLFVFVCLSVHVFVVWLDLWAIPVVCFCLFVCSQLLVLVLGVGSTVIVPLVELSTVHGV